MADVKISQLPAATTPLDGTEVLPIVQSATTKQVSIANVTAGRAMSASSLTLTTPLAVTSGGTGLATAAQGSLLSATGADTFSATRTPTLGLAGAAAGTLGLSGSTSGVVTLATAAAAGTWTFTLPTSGGTNGYILTTNGSGVSSWTNPTALGIDLNVGSTVVSDGTSGRILYNNAGVLGEYAVTGTGTTAVLSTSPTFTTGLTTPLAIGGTTASSSLTLQSTSGAGTSDSIIFKVGNNGATTAMTLDTSGNLGIGLPNPTTKLHLYGGAFLIDNGASAGTIYLANLNNYINLSSSTMQFAVNGSERARIDSSGNLLVGTTTTQQRLTVYSNGSGGTAYIYNTNASLGGNLVDVRADRNTTNGSYQYFSCYNQTAAAYKMYVIDSGKIYSTDTAIGSLSDARHKENIRDLDVGLDAIIQLKPRRFDWKANKGTGKKDVAGFIAQEVEPIFPDLIDAWKDAETPDLKALSMGGMVPAMVKAIQELAAKVSALEAK